LELDRTLGTPLGWHNNTHAHGKWPHARSALAEARSTEASKGNKRKRAAKPPPANNLAIVKWDARYLTEGEVNPQLVKLLPSKWNKHSLGAWRFILTDD